MREPLVIAMVVAIAGALAACSETPHPIPVGTNKAYYGNLVSGEKFGVRVGQPRKEVGVAMRQKGYEFVGNLRCDYTINQATGCLPTDNFDCFDRPSLFSHGSIYIRTSGEMVSGIAWEFYVLPYIDM